jgi:hypothetical protein
VGTVAHFITLAQDGSGRILYGNPHYVVCLEYDDGDEVWDLDPDFYDDGYLIMSASPRISPEIEYQNGDCDWVTILRAGFEDIVYDAPWGNMQILCTRKNFQLRGMNGSWRDATIDPIPRSAFPDERFAYVLNTAGYGWSARIHGWTISYDGKNRYPHVELTLRANYDSASWPEAPPYDSDAFHYLTEANSPLLSDIQFPAYPDAGYEDVLLRHWARVRDSRQLEDSEDQKPQWVDVNKIVSRIYCDSTSRAPQEIWTQNPADDPESTIGPDPNPLYYTLPWPRARFAMFTAHHCPTGSHGYDIFCRCQTNNTCPVYDENNQEIGYHDTWDTYTQGLLSDNGSDSTLVSGSGGSPIGGWPDCDAVDCDCDCCDE